MQHYLRPLVYPESVALVGASEQPGSLGRTVYENLLAGGFNGALYAVNPKHRTVLGQVSHPSLAAIGAPVDLAIIATPADAVADILKSGATARLKVAVLMTAPNLVDRAAVRAWSRNIAAVARHHRIRVIGPGALGVIRPDAGLDATFCAPSALPGRLALIAQSGAVATAILDFATPLGIGFSTVISLGGGIDVGFGELLDLMLVDPLTDGILLYVEDVGNARSFVSALRAAARTKPVVVLKSGRSFDAESDVPHDEVFDAALMRAGTVRVRTYTQLFAAARILSGGRIPHGKRVAIVSNGRGPAVLAADAAADRGLRLGVLAGETKAKLDALLDDGAPRVNPVDLFGDATPERLAGAVRVVLEDPGIDAVVALHVPRPVIPPLAAAQALADVARGSTKPVLAAWMGAVDRQEVHEALESGHVSNFFTPENAIDALSFLVDYRNNQQWLLEVPAQQPEPEPIDVAPIETLRLALAASGRLDLTASEKRLIVHTFGIGRYAVVETIEAAADAVHALRPPWSIELDATGTAATRRTVRSIESLQKAWTELHHAALADPPTRWSGRTVIAETALDANAPGLAVGVASDRLFGPVIFVKPGAAGRSLARRRALMLPPLNARLAADSIAFATAGATASKMDAATTDALIDLLIRVSALVCALPWVRRLDLDPVLFENGRVSVRVAHIDVDPSLRLLRGYPHMAIHPYPVELIGDVSLPDGTLLHVRPIRPEDAEIERAFVHGLSEQTRYFRFFYRMAQLTPAMLARFTQVDYDRELALVAVIGASTPAPEFVGVARYFGNPDHTSAEFAVVVADAWQRRGVARVLMRGLIVCAKRRGFEQLVGTILRENESMLAFVRSLGFTLSDDADDRSQVTATLELA